MIKLAYIVGGPMNFGGIESFILNNIRNFDLTQIKVTLIIDGDDKGYYDDELINKGVRIVNVPNKGRHLFRNLKAIKNLFETEKFDIVHSHVDAMGVLSLYIAKRLGIKIRIAHSHNTKHLTKNPVKLFINECAKFSLRFVASSFMACSKEAARWLFGKYISKNRTIIVKNAINTEKFLYDNNIRRKLRNQLGLTDFHVIGHVGRFDYQKNQEFLVELFKEIIKIDSKYKLVLVGTGKTRKNIIKYIKENSLEESVMILEPTEKINQYYNIFDVFCLPSRFEGLGMVVIEAQVNGLVCIVSTNVPNDVNILGKVIFHSLKEKDAWVHSILSCTREKSGIEINKVVQSGYDIKSQAMRLQKLYNNMVDGQTNV